MNEGRAIAVPWASSLTAAGPWDRRSKTALLVGSARDRKTWSRSSDNWLGTYLSILSPSPCAKDSGWTLTVRTNRPSRLRSIEVVGIVSSAALVACVMNAAPQTGMKLRLDLKPGAKYNVSLNIERHIPSQSGQIRQLLTVVRRQGSVTTLDDSITGLTVGAVDRSTDLIAMLSKRNVTFAWTDRAQRSGDMNSIAFRKVDRSLTPVLNEAGLYLCEFPSGPVAPGSTWAGSTTATGGCTGCTYTLLEFRNEKDRKLAVVVVTKIALPADVDQVGPMVMVVDTKTGLPDNVEYTVQNKKTLVRSTFVQIIKAR
jgi:hypothetical protein